MELNEMAVTRAQAIETCIHLGRQFIEHFHKVYAEGKYSQDFPHHCTEMQTWLNDARRLKLKTTKRYIDTSNLIDWFFTAGEAVDKDLGFDDYEEADLYNEFFIALCANKSSKVIDVLNKILYV